MVKAYLAMVVQMWLEEDTYVPNILIAGVILLLIFLGFFYFEYKEDATTINEIQKENSRLVTENNNLRTHIIQLENENIRLKQKQQDMYDELAQFVAQEAIWELSPYKWIRFTCRIAQILWREDFPAIENLPC